MVKLTPEILMNQTATIVAHTSNGWTNTEIMNKFNDACLRFGKSFFYEKDQYQSKVSSYLENFSKFSEKELYLILKDVFREDKFKDNENIQQAFNNLIRDNAQDYEDSNENFVETYNITSHFLSKYELSYNQYKSAYHKIIANIFERNALDDLRLSFELLVKELLSNNRSLENNINDLCKELKNKGVVGEINSLFNRVLNFFTSYQNEYVKHNDLVESNSVEFIFDISSSLLKYLAKIF